jgi:uncharacterized protein with GYD domain
MQRFVFTMKLTSRGARSLETLPQFCDMVATIWEEIGGRMDRLEITSGRFDLIATGTFPSFLHAMQFSTTVSADGYVSLETSASVDHRDATDVSAILPRKHGTLTVEKKVEQED